MNRTQELPQIVSARDEWLRDASGRDYIDLCMGYGSVWLGHAHDAVLRALKSQLDGYCAPGFLPTGALEEAETALAPFIPSTHFLGGIYSTGMEAMETALRAARVQTGRRAILGFAGSTHGRSFLTAAIGGSQTEDGAGLVHQLPSFGVAGLDEVEPALRDLVERGALAAIVVEPVQMTGGGYEITERYARRVIEIARAGNVPVIFDETLTGLHRCGPCYYADHVGEMPDMLVIGKGLGNGFPCAAVLPRKNFAWDRQRVRPGSTFWNHPLACAAVEASAKEIARADPQARVARIETIVRDTFAGMELRGRGALWCLGVPRPDLQSELVGRILHAGVVVSYYERHLRLLPHLLIDPDTLQRACHAIRQAYADTFR